MWKLILGFIVFAAAAMYMLSKGGDIDMGGEKHGVESHDSASAHGASAPAASAASN
ncbi:MAG: hypothetical protein RL654_2468 [Pseudomonadota bacterium]|jgi:hypothetical protein